jgi:hypothetical protein
LERYHQSTWDLNGWEYTQTTLGYTLQREGGQLYKHTIAFVFDHSMSDSLSVDNDCLFS